MKKTYAMTLLEIMIVIFIIGIIGSVVGYNMRGSLDQGKAFKTKESIRKIYEVLELEKALGNTVAKDSNNLEQSVTEVLIQSGLIRKPTLLVTDGWGDHLHFFIDPTSKDIRFTSENYEKYCVRKGMSTDYPWDEELKEPSQS